MSMNVDEAETLRRRRTQSLRRRTYVDTAKLSYTGHTRTGISLWIGQSMELMRRILLVHGVRGPTLLFAMLLSLLLIGGATFWPTVGLKVISGRSASLYGQLVSRIHFLWYLAIEQACYIGNSLAYFLTSIVGKMITILRKSVKRRGIST
ncbi:hypothetical protein D915_010550 [Fasciola hepatica]|uniref:Uncharacterized protein n=1 Tax=Fasciola hepatica TaxID=6192 RepID=A0A4E0QZB9_FASHE|nr:hypothetical protein D915_010550 [Fasciola hepatica]